MTDALRADAATYARVFEGHHEGRLILEDLVRRFYDVEPFRKGGIDAARETDYRLGARSVVHHILTRIGQVGMPDPNEEPAG